MKSSASFAKKPGFDADLRVFPLSVAKTYLGRLIDKAENGESVYISRGTQRFVLSPAPEIDPIPIRPPGYFKNVLTKAEIDEENQLAKASVVRPPEDLE